MQSVLPFASLPAWFEHQVSLTPGATALVFEDAVLTYEELNRRANRMARSLEKKGVGPEKIVAICLERSVDLMVALLAIQKAGGAYLPVDPALPEERQVMMLEDAGAVLVLAQSSLLDLIPKTGSPIYNVDAERDAIAAESAENLATQVESHYLAYLLYTSGSTGKPKGVEVEQGSLVNLLASVQKHPGLTANDVFCAIATLSFDIAATEVFLPLVTGAKLVLLSRDDASDGFRLLKQITDHDATVLQATPATWRMLLETSWEGSPKMKLFTTGEAFPRDLGPRLLPKGRELWNLYGPTETTIYSAVARIVDAAAPLTFDLPVANTQLYILDNNLQPVPMGVTGELFIGGIGLARGYHNRPELTAEKFIRDPFSTAPGARLYRTGDLARIKSAGVIEVLGRIDHQVKIRGFRIELGEIEAKLASHPQVKEAVVIAREDTPGRKQLAAYLVLRSETPAGAKTLSAELRDYLEASLPDYMVPSFFEVLPAIPKTPTGKINRKALPRPSGPSTTPERPYVAPRDETETKLAEIWQQVLGREKVGIHDQIFEIGGDSLLIFQITARANQAGLPLSLRQFFQLRTIAELAEALKSGPATTESGVSAPIARVSRDSYRRPASPAAK
jgi:amino acid adenylation domain-containing protein